MFRFSELELVKCRWYSIASSLQQHLQHQLRKCSNDTMEKKLHIRYQNGLPMIEVPLPSKKEMCQFTLKPVNDTVARFCKNIECEDEGVKIVYVYSTSGCRIAGSTSLQHLLLQGNFRLRVNDFIYTVEVPSSTDVAEDDYAVQKFDDLRSTVASLYTFMNVEKYKAYREQILLDEYKNVKAELKPLIQAKSKIDELCRKRAQRVLWLIFAAMGFKVGFLARLTWWEYTWDTMEPITYFAAYGTLMASLAYYLYTNQYYSHSDHKKRAMSVYFHKKAEKSNFDISRFNELQNVANSLKHDLETLRDPLYQSLSAARLASFVRKSEKIRSSALKKKNKVDSKLILD